MRQRFIKTFALACAMLLVASGVMYASVSGEAEDRRISLNAVYQRAFYETCELISGMQVNMKKLIVTGSRVTEMELLSEISMQAQGVESNLSMLPIGVGAVSASIKFVNQMGDYARTLTRKLASGDALSAADRAQLTLMLESSTSFGLQLNSLLVEYNEGRLEFEGYDFEYDGTQELYPLTNPAGEYPMLLYDGPFSDGRRDEDMRALTGDDMTEADARERMTAFLGKSLISDIVFTGESDIPAPCYEFEFVYGGYNVSAGVSKTGGHIMYMLPMLNEYAAGLSAEALAQAGREFLSARGLKDAHLSYMRAFEGVLTANFAPVDEGRILYPDLIKVQLSAKDGQVIGLEARSYYQNHTRREYKQPLLTAEQAMSLVGAELVAESARLCVIPLNSSEAQCYEVRALSGEDVYLVYIDAETGEEHVLYQLVATDEGTLVM